MAKATFTFEKNINKSLKQQASKAIINAVEGSPEMRKEIRRVFQMANRRIQNIEQANVFSPAVASLGKGGVKGYSKFSVKGFGSTGESWTELKKEYGKAVAFLQQPTSTAAGAREFEKQVQSQLNIPNERWENVRETIVGGYNATSSDLMAALPYSTFMQEIYDRAAATANDEIERDAIAAAEQLQAEINAQAAGIAGQIDAILNGWEIGG